MIPFRLHQPLLLLLSEPGKDSSGNTVGAGLRPARYRKGDIDFFVADAPVYLTSFGLAQVSGSGNPFQLITLTISKPYCFRRGRRGQDLRLLFRPPQPPVLKAPPLPDPGKTAKIYSNTQGVITQATTLQSTDGLATDHYQ